MTYTSELEPQMTFPQQGAAPHHAAPEAREELSIRGPFPSCVRGADAEGRRFVVPAALERLSAASCDLLWTGRAEPGASLTIVTRVSRAVVLLRGTVVGVRSPRGGASGASVRITRYRFVPRRHADEDAAEPPPS